MSTPPSTTTRAEPTERWPTAITQVEPNKVLLRGYPVDELMGRVSFSDAIYLVLTGELPDRTVSRVMDALLISTIDHGATPPATVAARNVASTGAPLRAAAAAASRAACASWMTDWRWWVTGCRTTTPPVACSIR